LNIKNLRKRRPEQKKEDAAFKEIFLVEKKQKGRTKAEDKKKSK
jgi:hypothetical protein